MCSCTRCVDQSSRQKHFSTVDIPPKIGIETLTNLPDGLEIEWKNDMPGFEGHKSVFSRKMIDAMASTGRTSILPELPSRRLWNNDEFREETSDLTYEAYMEDDSTLLKALRQMQTYGLLFLRDVPEDPESVIRITQRIGPLKNTFYGDTWDVRSVPQAKNVAYTSQDLGFHMDLLYLKQPPHLQFLHCIRSSSNGGASLFTDSFRAVAKLYQENRGAFDELIRRPITYHYDHIDSHYYQHSRPLIEIDPSRFGGGDYTSFRHLQRTAESFKLDDYLEAVSWSPPFQAPFQLSGSHSNGPDRDFTGQCEVNIRSWHGAAREFNSLIHDKQGIHERMMKPGECVIFDNRRVLHARKAFEVADAGKERWLRGSYLDKDPFLSKLRVLMHRFESNKDGEALNGDEKVRAEAAAAAA